MKFDAMGNALPYPGNTIICDVPPGDPAFAALRAMQDGLRRSPLAGCFAFLPAESFHMTLYRGVNDKRRLQAEWPPDIPLDAPLDEVTAEFARRLGGVDLENGFVMRPVELVTNPTGESQLMLEGRDEGERERLARIRGRIAGALRHKRSDEEGYRFHITFSYMIREPGKAERLELEALQNELFDLLLYEVKTIRVAEPRLCRYDDMLAFHPVAAGRR